LRRAALNLLADDLASTNFALRSLKAAKTRKRLALANCSEVLRGLL